MLAMKYMYLVFGLLMIFNEHYCPRHVTCGSTS